MNRYLVSAFMNRFPLAATKILSKSRGEMARLLFAEREGGSFRVLRAMYDYEDPSRRGDLLNRLMMACPAIRAARNRRAIAQQMLDLSLKAQPADSPVLVLAVGGGDGSLEMEVIARSPRKDIYYCGVDKDERAIEANRHVLRQHGMSERGFVSVGNIAETRDLEAVLAEARRRFRAPFAGANAAMCHGITEYLDMGSQDNETLAALLRAIFACSRPEARLIISQTDYHDRVAFLERGLAWYMRLRTMDELATEVEKAGWQISVCEHEPMELISMCLAVKSDRTYRRIDSPSRLKPYRKQRRLAAAPWRFWRLARQ